MSVVIFTVIDLETSGLAPPASVIEIGWTQIHFETETKAVGIGHPQSKLFKPREPLAPENIAVHHLTNEYLSDCRLCTDDDLREVAQLDFPQFLVAASCAFEQQWFTDEITGVEDGPRPFWICTVKAAAQLYPDAESHSNQATRYRLGLDLPDELAMPPHRAGPDSYVTAHILGRFLETGTRVRDLVQWTMQPKLMARCPIGKKWRGTPWADVEASFLEWMLSQADMDADAKHWARVELDRRRAAA